MLADLRGFVSAASLAALLVVPAAATAQGLSLTYKLDPVAAPQSPKPSALVNRCSGMTWAASLAAACIAEATAARVVHAIAVIRGETQPPESVAESRRIDVPGSYSAADAAPRRYELPALGTPVEARVLRSAGGRDEYIGNARGVDVNFRFGSKYRMRPGEEGWEVYRFSDVTSENRLQSNGMKNVGVELLFPFQ